MKGKQLHVCLAFVVMTGDDHEQRAERVLPSMPRCASSSVLFDGVCMVQKSSYRLEKLALAL